MSSRKIPEKCGKCSRSKEYYGPFGYDVCPVCGIEWDAEVWDRVIMQKPIVAKRKKGDKTCHYSYAHKEWVTDRYEK